MNGSPPTDDSGASGQFSVRALPLHLRIMSFVFGVMFLLTLVICGHLMWTAEHPAAAHHRRFFVAVQSGRPEEVLALCGPALREKIDQPVLAAWLEAVDRRLGAFQGISRQGFEGRESEQEGVPIVETRGTAHFERGSVYAELHYENDRLTDLVVRCEELPANWCSAWK